MKRHLFFLFFKPPLNYQTQTFDAFALFVVLYAAPMLVQAAAAWTDASSRSTYGIGDLQESSSQCVSNQAFGIW